MSLIAFEFFCFTLLTLIVYYCLPRKYRWQFLLTASIIYYVTACGPVLTAIMCAASLAAWSCAFFMKRARRKGFVLAAFVLSLAVLLMAYKENAFFVNMLNTGAAILGKRRRLPLPYWVAPLGISYWSLMLFSYVADVFWGKCEAESNPLKVLLYTCFFPQMTLGPISRYSDMRSEFFAPRPFDIDNLSMGFQRVFWGLFKKLVLAERLALIVANIYGEAGNGGNYQGFLIALGAIAYVLQVFMDFSGAIDIVLGVARMLGIKLPENFDHPFTAQSLSEIWQRWHMTLGFWVRDYVMYPAQKTIIAKLAKPIRKKFGKQASKKIPLYLSMLVTWFTVGFWHGGAWKFIFGSGLFFFVMIVGGLLLEPVFEFLKRLLQVNAETWSWRFFGRVRSFLLFTLSVSFGRAASLRAGFAFWRRAFHWNPWVFFDGTLFKIGLDGKDFWVMVIGMCVVAFVSRFEMAHGSAREWLKKQNIVFKWAVLFGLIFATLIFGMYGEGYNPADFIYGGF